MIITMPIPQRKENKTRKCKCPERKNVQNTKTKYKAYKNATAT